MDHKNPQQPWIITSNQSTVETQGTKKILYACNTCWTAQKLTPHRELNFFVWNQWAKRGTRFEKIWSLL